MAVSGTDLFLGCPQMNFKANPPFNEMGQGFADFKKEIRMAQYFPELTTGKFLVRSSVSTFLGVAQTMIKTVIILP